MKRRAGSTVVIPAYNQAALTRQCVDAVLEMDPCEVVVVDDASTDATARVLAAYGRRVRTVAHKANRGFAVSCNDGAALGRGEFVVFLNNDTIPRRGWLKALERYADRHPAAAVVGSKLLYPDTTIQHAGVVICRDRYPRHVYTGFPSDHPAVNVSRPFQIVTAACMLVRRRVFVKAGGFDPAFQNGFEDVDFCLRLGLAGHEVHYCADSVVQHLESVSPGRFSRDRHNVDLYRKRWIDRVRPDDLERYLEDGLLELAYEGRYPFNLRCSPLLATVESGGHHRLLREKSRQVAELMRENTRLSIELGRARADSPELQYRDLRARIREAVQQFIPAGATVLVVSKGDGALLEHDGRPAWHFPRTERGAYAGHHPADSAAAIRHLESLRTNGARYLLFPRTSLWWLDHYAAFRDHLDRNYRKIAQREDACVIFDLNARARPGTADERQANLDAALRRQEWLASALASERQARRLLEASVATRAAASAKDLRAAVRAVVPVGSSVLVVSRGDPALLRLPACRARHFPQASGGGYAGHHPADSGAAIAHLEQLVSGGARYLLFPAAAFWWLEHYTGFGEYLDRTHERVWSDNVCAIFRLSARAPNRDESSQARAPTATPRTRRPGEKYDVVCFPIVDWGFRFQRPQQLMSRFAAAGHRVFHLSHQFRASGEPCRMRALARNVREVSLRAFRVNAHQGVLHDDARDALVSALGELRRAIAPGAVAVVQSPFWWPVVKEAAASFGWPVVYDRMDLHAGFSTNHGVVADQERELMARADLVVASSAVLEADARRYNRNVLLVRNGCDYRHFSRVRGRTPGARPVIGYYGAIADWFDTDLVADLAERRADWDFVLVGSTHLSDVSRLARLPNVSLPGEKPYREIPKWLGRFDVAILPFKRTPLTEAANPVKAYEIFASGKPLVSVPLPEMTLLAPLARIARDVAGFEREIEAELERPDGRLRARRRALARDATWDRRFAALAPAVRGLVRPLVRRRNRDRRKVNAPEGRAPARPRAAGRLPLR
jgi:GT2 family glycosyltransferase